MSNWNSIRPSLLKQFQKLGITRCELQLDGCLGSSFLSIAHRYKRRWYLSHPDKLGDLQHCLILCQNCHDKLEFNARLTEESFIRLRDNNPKFKFEPAPVRVFKSDWQKQHPCIHCGFMGNFLVCPNCHKISVLTKT